MRKYTSLPYTEYTVATGRYDESRKPITIITLHTMVGTMQSTRNLFANPPAAGKETSAHYGVGYNGEIDAYLEEYFTAYANGNYDYNQRSISIEHEDKGNYNSPRPDALYETSAKLVADICKYYGIPCEAAKYDGQGKLIGGNIFKHNQVPGSSTACPAALDTNRIIARAKEILGGGATPPTGCPQNITRKSSYFDDLAHDEWGTDIDTDEIDREEFEEFRSTLKVRKVGNGNWDIVKNAAGLPNTQDPQAVINALKKQGAQGNTDAAYKKGWNEALVAADKADDKAIADLKKK